jgi:hypothetical protein
LKPGTFYNNRDARERELERKRELALKSASGTQQVMFCLRLTGLKLATIQSSWKSKTALTNMIAEQFQVPSDCVMITNLSAGSVVVQFEGEKGGV